MTANDPSPAVPVGVQPEPGDRAERWAATLNLAHTRGFRGTLVKKAMALADAEVAAAVAAVRAERDDRVEEYRETTRDTVNHLYATIDRAVEAEAERDALAGQVAAIRALHGKVPEPFLDGERYSCSTCTDGEGNAIDWPCPTLVASSPTTPEAKK